MSKEITSRRKKKLSRRPFKLRWFSKRKHCTCRRHNRHAVEEVVDDVVEVSRASQGSQAQPHEDEGKAKKAEENPM
jgi:phosphoribosyl-dephospho-CoA transferase